MTGEPTGHVDLENLEWEKISAGPWDADRLEYCLRKVREADELESGLDWNAEVVPGLTVEELLGGLAEAEEVLEYCRDM
jgi:hypothetical protein